ncbi:MAG: hypothetical protein GXO99_05180 [Nitrospirae bacterium]|nr:hypothetical protein [Nitrospirota bacterium]
MAERFSVREVVEQAVRTERLGYDFYTKMAERFKENEDLNRLFTTLAEKELVHEERFKELYEIIGDEEPEGWEEVSEYMRAFVESEFFLADRAMERMKNIKSAEEAADYALAFEKETLLYYVGLRNSVKEKEVLDEIINEEQSHIMWINRFLRKSG